MAIEPITHLEKSIAGTATPTTHFEKVIAGVVDPVTHLEKVYAEYGGGEQPTGTIEITDNGTYDVTNYTEAEVTVSKIPDMGYIFTDYNEDNMPTTLYVKGIKEIPSYCFGVGFDTRRPSSCILNTIKKIIIGEGTTTIGYSAFSAQFWAEEIILPTTITYIGEYAFRYCQNIDSIVIPNTNLVTIKMGLIARQSNVGSFTKRIEIHGDCSLQYTFITMSALKEVIIGGQVVDWVQVGKDPKVELYDFSGCDNIFTLQIATAEWFPHADGCVIRVKQSLLDEWKAATNWSALPTDPTESGYVIWEGV